MMCSRYADICHFMRWWFPDGRCPQVFIDHGLPCTCPFVIPAHKRLTLNNNPLHLTPLEQTHIWLNTVTISLSYSLFVFNFNFFFLICSTTGCPSKKGLFSRYSLCFMFLWWYPDPYLPSHPVSLCLLSISIGLFVPALMKKPSSSHLTLQYPLTVQNASQNLCVDFYLL